MILVLGEILFDCFPDHRRLGGAPFNFAFHLKQLGLDVRFASCVGNDRLGEEILTFVSDQGFSARDIQVDPDHPTGAVEIRLDHTGGHTFSILPDQAYDHMAWNTGLEAMCAEPPALVYFGTLIQRTAKGEALIRQVLDAVGQKAIKFCDINLRPDCHTPDVVAQSIARSDILKLSEEELDTLVPGDPHKIQVRAETLLARPGPELVILTRGSRGSLWVSGQGGLTLPAETLPGPLRDTVGAGDAYAAMATAGRLKGLPDTRTMALAQEFAALICTMAGALPEDKTIYDPFKSRLIS